MPTGVNSRNRVGIWSYLPFGSNPRRRSISIPTKSVRDPFEKADRHSRDPFRSTTTLTFRNIFMVFAMTQSQRTRYFKTWGVIAILLLFLYVLLPSGTSVPATINTAVSSTKCTKPYDSSKPLIQYALMIDAGSTGSRIHVYRFNNCGHTPELENEDFKMTEKKKGGAGLSAYANDPEAAAKSLDPLMEVALKAVPKEYQSCSPVAVKATAGLRFLGQETSDKILEAVRDRLETVYPFPVVSKERGGVEIMDGKYEGVYAWITTNYLLGNIGTKERIPTAAVFDLGGGSTQIVFEPTFKSVNGAPPEQLAEGAHKFTLNFGGRDFALYQHSHLGYGLMKARETIHQAVVEAKHESSPNDQSWLSKPLVNPCLSAGMNLKVNVTLGENHPLGKVVEVNMTGPKDISSAAQCRGISDKILKKDSECKMAPCSFNGVHQPPLQKTFAQEDLYIMSYFYDRTAPLGMPESFTLRDLQDLTSTVCSGYGSWGVFESIKDALSELLDRPEHCLDLSFMLSLLHTGYDLPLSRQVKIAKKIKGNELGWCLGASLPLLNKESGWQCRVKEVS
ncbi:guanosine-diphosphatase [Paracoccidioides lutzii Pb01]|uniref:guanosine-diphosphatase n=1 Tax=Paracoccidioides lutzii (strain ATCC MYA-826 / Pb01) TaxID=502779 RepID=C1GWM8_PARBA|nr:guanosine-diphosphatase [Paracoccidioides lutzii Pb01]EEH40947.1 guanosine-diphosphatase [Paracoccidioides lutzii Pb01]